MVQQRIPASGLKKYTLEQVRAILEGQGYDAEEVERKVEGIRKERALLRAKKVKHVRAVTYWRYLRTPLKREIEIAKSSLAYIKSRGNDDTVKREAYEAYLMVLGKLLHQFDVYAEVNPSDTPTQVLHQEQERGKLKFVTKGEHWADWVPAKVKLAVQDLFDEVPYRKQAKVKKPFERRIPKGSQRSRRTMLDEAMAKELDTLQVKHAAYTAAPGMSDALLAELQTQRDRLMSTMRKIKRAQSVLREKRDNKPFPITWHGLLVDEE